MKTRYVLGTVVLLIFAICISAIAAVHVNGYFRSNGTYVAPHYRSNPDGNFYNNWSTKGNVNPYTGQEGTKSNPSSTYGYAYSYSPIPLTTSYTTQNPYSNEFLEDGQTFWRREIREYGVEPPEKATIPELIDLQHGLAIGEQNTKSSFFINSPVIGVTTSAIVDQEQAKQLSSDIVYITKTGAKYHRAGCRYLSRSCIPISRKDAIAQGYTACKVCKP